MTRADSCPSLRCTDVETASNLGRTSQIGRDAQINHRAACSHTYAVERDVTPAGSSMSMLPHHVNWSGVAVSVIHAPFLDK